MKRYGVNHHFSTSYHPQTSGQVENTNRALKRILEKTVKDNPAIWSRKLNDALWAFRTAYKTPTGTTPYKLIYGKNYHLPFEIEHRAYWTLKNCNPDLIVAGEKRMFQLHELDELRHQAYENSVIPGKKEPKSGRTTEKIKNEKGIQARKQGNLARRYGKFRRMLKRQLYEDENICERIARFRKKGVDDMGTNFIYFVGGDYDGDRKMDDLKFFYRAYIADALSGGRMEKDKDLCAKVQIFLENSSSLWEMMRLILQ
ncbi:reverse transcriptase domain-containing protein [Tanacetum coccineum]